MGKQSNNQGRYADVPLPIVELQSSFIPFYSLFSFPFLLCIVDMSHLGQIPSNKTVRCIAVNDIRERLFYMLILLYKAIVGHSEIGGARKNGRPRQMAMSAYVQHLFYPRTFDQKISIVLNSKPYNGYFPPLHSVDLRICSCVAPISGRTKHAGG